MGDGVRSRAVLALASAAGAILAASLSAGTERLIADWADRLARTGNARERARGVAKLEELGDAGVPMLLELARDRTPFPHADERNWRAPVPPDLIPRQTVGDLALDALRRLMAGGEAPRDFEWQLAEGRYPSFQAAMEAWRQGELDKAREWWRARSQDRARVNGH
jgi:hypothetical protein